MSYVTRHCTMTYLDRSQVATQKTMRRVATPLTAWVAHVVGMPIGSEPKAKHANGRSYGRRARDSA